MDEQFQSLAIGKGEVLREGTEVTLVGLGTMTQTCLAAADELARDGISAAVVNPRFIKPLDADLLVRMGRQTGAVVTVEESFLAGGFGAAVLELYSEAGLAVPVKRIGIPDMFVPHGNADIYRKEFGLTPAGVAETARQLVMRVRSELEGRRRKAPSRKATVLEGSLASGLED